MRKQAYDLARPGNFGGAERPNRHSRIMSKSPLAGLSVLLLEDEVMLRKRLAGFLEKEGADVTAVSTVAAARQARDERSESAPYGFSTRVAALAMSAPQSVSIATILDRFSWRALGIASVLAIGSVGVSYGSWSTSTEEELLSDEPVVSALFDSSGT